MTMSDLVQGSKTLLEAIYETERLLQSKGSKTEINKVVNYALKIIANMKKVIEQEQNNEH